MSFSTRAMLVGLMLVFVPSFSASAQDAKANRNNIDILVEEEVEEDNGRKYLNYIVQEVDSTNAIEEVPDEEPMEPSPYWFGIQCEPIGQFEMTTEVTGVITVVGGLKINAVIEGSPAEGAKLEEGDILFKCDGKTMLEMRDLIDLTRTKGESPISTRIFRNGELKSIEITPAKRPESGETERWVDFGNQNFSFFYPNIDEEKLEIPEGYGFTIQLAANKEPDIKAEKDGSVWPVVPGKLSELPEDLQGVANYLVTRLTPVSSSTYRIALQPGVLNGVETAEVNGIWRYSLENKRGSESEEANVSEKLNHLQKEIEALKLILVESLKGSDPASSKK